MEKQILQTLEWGKKHLLQEFPENPKAPDEHEKQVIVSDLLRSIDSVKESNGIEDYSISLMECIYSILIASHKSGIADRMTMIFDEIHKNRMSNEDNSINITPIMERDFTAYSDLKEVADKVILQEREMLHELVKNNIERRLKPEDKEVWDEMHTKEAHIESAVKVKYVNRPIEENYALVTVYGKEERVQINWNKQKAPKKKNKTVKKPGRIKTKNTQDVSIK